MAPGCRRGWRCVSETAPENWATVLAAGDPENHSPDKNIRLTIFAPEAVYRWSSRGLQLLLLCRVFGLQQSAVALAVGNPKIHLEVLFSRGTLDFSLQQMGEP
jgi:hypothetical protein